MSSKPFRLRPGPKPSIERKYPTSHGVNYTLSALTGTARPSVRKLARILQVHNSDLCDILNGRRNAHAGIVLAISQALNIDAANVLQELAAARIRATGSTRARITKKEKERIALAFGPSLGDGGELTRNVT